MSNKKNFIMINGRGSVAKYNQVNWSGCANY